MKKVWILHVTANAEEDNFETNKLVKAFRRDKFNVEVYQPKNFDIITSRKGGKSIRYKGEFVTLPDIVLVRTGAGTHYFTQALLRQLEGFDIPLVNSCDSIIKCRDKMWSGQLLTQAKIPVPRTMLVNFPVNTDIVEQEIGFPCVVKLVSGSQGKGVYKCEDRKFFEDLMELIHTLKTKKSIMVQEYVTDGSQATDLRVWVIGGKAVAAMQRTAPDGDFRANIHNGGTGKPVEITKEIAEISEKTAAVFGLEIAGIDLLHDGKHFKVCEANSSPGFEGIDQFCGTDMSSEIVKHCRKLIK
jgi:gamma-F420-2:alpha-L-glutamate ligase